MKMPTYYIFHGLKEMEGTPIFHDRRQAQLYAEEISRVKKLMSVQVVSVKSLDMYHDGKKVERK